MVEAPHEHEEPNVVVNFDAFPSMMHLPSIDVEHMKEALFEFIDDPQTPIERERVPTRIRDVPHSPICTLSPI